MAGAGGLKAAEFPPGALVIALSGGADSAVCGWLALQTEQPVRAIHVDHRWPDSAMMRQAAQDVAAHLGLSLQVIEVEVPAGSSPENQARLARYDALLAALAPDEVLCTGHTSDDQAETVLGNLIRGAGLDGLTGVGRRRAKVHRPLLGLSRHEVRAKAIDLGLPFVDDPANTDPRYTRVRIRQLIDDVEVSLGPGVSERITQTAGRLAADADLLDNAACSVPIWQSQRRIRVALGELAARPLAVQNRVLRRLARTAHPPYAGESDELMRLMRVATGEIPQTDVGEGWRARRRGPWLEMFCDVPEPAQAHWELPGTTSFGSYSFAAEMVEDRLLLPHPLSRWILYTNPAIKNLVIRGATTADVISRGEGHKSVWDALAEHGVPADDRPVYPVVIAGDALIWVPGIRTDPTIWPQSGGDRYLCLTAREDLVWHPLAP